MKNEEMKKMKKIKFVIITAAVFLVLITATLSASARLAVKLTPDDKIGEDDPGEPKQRFPPVEEDGPRTPKQRFPPTDDNKNQIDAGDPIHIDLTPP
jgi:hypothetical protein